MAVSVTAVVSAVGAVYPSPEHTHTRTYRVPTPLTLALLSTLRANDSSTGATIP